jgi:tRNA-specific 2-thiouridylase
MTPRHPSSVVVALSGGVDSSLAAALLKEEGWEVQGVHFVLPSSDQEREGKQRAAERVARHLGIPLATVDLGARFEERVVRPFVEGYLAGRTPNPCVVCNPEVKFDALHAWADGHGVWFGATGHYARIADPEGGDPALLRGRDPQKEQSYFLHRLGRRALGRSLFPLGGLLKAETRVMAAGRGLPTRSSPESQEICFLSGEDYRSFLERRDPDGASRRGSVVDTAGRRLGEHRGVFRFTIGQRRGLGIASDEPYYVVALRPGPREVVVGRREELFSRRVEAASFSWIGGIPDEARRRAEAQVRYRHPAAPGRLEPLGKDRVRFVFDEPQLAVTPGQALVCYDGERVLGGGWIVPAGGGPG